MRLTSELRKEVDLDQETPRGSEAVELLGSIADDRRTIAACVQELHQEAMMHGDPRYVKQLLRRITFLEGTLQQADDSVCRGRLRGVRTSLKDAVARLPKRATS